MAERYHHWITKAREGTWPDAIVCVDCLSEPIRTDKDFDGIRERFASWHCVSMVRQGDDYVNVAAAGGQIARSFLAGLAQYGKRMQNVLVVSWRCTRIWSLLGVWEEIEQGRVRLVDNDDRASRARKERERQYRLQLDKPLRQLSSSEIRNLDQASIGYVVLEDPPNIMKARAYGSPTHFLWVDIRNYGVDLPDTVEPGANTARCLADAVKRIAQVCKANGLTAIKPTVGGQAMAAWRHTFLKESVHVHTDERVTRLEDAAYCGGRCETTRIGPLPAPTYHVDFRSQYGYISARCQLPTGLCDYLQCDYPQAGNVSGWPHCCIAAVMIETDEPAYPVRREGEVIYPIGRYRTVLAGPELQDAVMYHRIKEVYAVATYTLGYPLRECAEALYKIRCEEEQAAVPGVADWAKRMIVCLPGKLGQKLHRWVDCPDIMLQEMYGEWYGESEGEDVIRYRAIAGFVQRDSVDGFTGDAVPAIAAFVTSYGRIRLLTAIRTAGAENVHYYDTDSLILNAKGYDRLLHSSLMSTPGIGQLTLRAQPQYCEIRGIKYYVQDRKVTCAGMPRGHIVDLGDGQHYARYLSAIDQARAGLRPESTVVHGVYPRTKPYHHGTVGPDGTVTPIVLREE